MRSALRRALGRERPAPAPDPFLATTSPTDRAIVERAKPYTLTSVQRLQAVIDAVRYIERRGIPGALAECGVWRGGSVLAMLLTLQDAGATERDVYLYDTFTGMTDPTEADTSPFDDAAREGAAYDYLFDPEHTGEDAVLALLAGTGYPRERLHAVAGPVEETLPAHAPEQLALLRLDTDWYESTRHELEHLYDRLSPGGVLIVDDYGHWEGAARAVEEFFATREPLLLSRIDYTGRIAVKA